MAHPELPPDAYRDVVRRALDEDLGEAGDITTDAVVPPDRQARATLVAKSTCVVAGLAVVGEVFYQVDSHLRWTPMKEDGERCRAGDTLGTVAGAARTILSSERTALNFLQHLSGVATLARRFVDMAGSAVVILDTRKTVPTLRALEKYAVLCGGARNHRAGLYDGVIVKDNHIAVAGSIAEAVRRVRARVSLPIEVEAQSLREVEDALAARAEIVMLDNLPDEDIREAVRLIGGRARVEVSGGMTLERVGALSHLGIDCVSVGAVTHSAPAADISLEIEVRRVSVWLPPPAELAAALAAAAPRLGPYGHLRYTPEIGSTNDAALALAAAGAPEGTSVLADVQTAGRGRRGRTWHSPSEAGLYLSVVVRTAGWRSAVPLATLAAGVAAADAVQAASGLSVELKWPNDLVVGRPWRKLGGILCEAAGAGGDVEALAIGIGVNLRSAAYPPDVAARATSLESELGRGVDRSLLLAEVLAALREIMDALRAGDHARVCDRWRARARAGFDGARVRWHDAGGERRGVAIDIDTDGALLVQCGGRLERLIAGEVVWERM